MFLPEATPHEFHMELEDICRTQKIRLIRAIVMIIIKG